MVDTKHTATGQMAGYLFQPDRALVFLCSCKNNHSVSIELIDDIAAIDETGTVVYREQDKSSIQTSGQPFKDRSKDLWNTLMIWATDIKNGSLNPEITKLVCVTNKTLTDKSLIKIIAEAKTPKEIDDVIFLLKKAATNPPATLKETISKVLADEDVLKKLIPLIHLLDCNSFDARNEEIANELGLNDDIKDDVITDLRGWLNENILLQLDKGKAPVIKKTEFNQRLQKARQNAGDKKIKVLAKRFLQIEITNDNIAEAKERLFVKQLEVIQHYDKENIIIDAIDDFFYSEHQRTLLVIQGDITGKELLAMDDTSKERWKESFRRKMTQYNVAMIEEQLSALAYEIYDSTIGGYLAKIRGSDTEPYFTKGSFHKLSDALIIGWHPHWENLFTKE
jgi:hypothetical protein